MNAPDTTTPAAELVGSNVPEHWECLTQALAKYHPQREDFAVWRDKENRRSFKAAPVTEKPGKGWERCETITWTDAALAMTTETATAAVRAAVPFAIGYHWTTINVWHAPLRLEKYVLSEQGHGKPQGAGKRFASVTPHVFER